jgi:hypothetical protein
LPFGCLAASPTLSSRLRNENADLDPALVGLPGNNTMCIKGIMYYTRYKVWYIGTLE